MEAEPAMSLTAGVRFSGDRGSAPQMSVVQPILNLRDAAGAG